MNRILPWTLVVLLCVALIWTNREKIGIEASAAAAQKKKQSPWDRGWAIYDGEKLLQARKKKGRAYLPFLRTPALYCGIYALPKNGKDGQSPHKHDEVYYVLSGKGKLAAGAGADKKTTAFGKGAVIYVKAGVEHRFVDISEDLELLVFFSTAQPKKK